MPPEKSDRFIILRGVIDSKGSVIELEVLRGVVPELDQAALAAFQRWKFQPAFRGAQPQAVEILVGIPAVVPQ